MPETTPAPAAASPAQAAPATVDPEVVARPRSRRSSADILARYGLLFAFLLTILFFSVAKSSVFPTSRNAESILAAAGPSLILAVGLTVVLVMQDFDLSIGAMIGLAAGAAESFMVESGTGWIVGSLLVLLIAVLAGVANGFMVAFLGGNSFIITLAMGTVLTGVEFAFTGQNTVYSGFPDGFAKLTDGSLLGISTIFWIAAVVSVLIWVLLERTEVGRYMYAIGGNPEAARLSGVRVRAIRVLGFVIVAFFAAVVGLLLTSQSASYAPNSGISYLLPAFAAVFLGAAVFRPGEFNVAGTVIGVLFLGVIQTGLTLLNLQTYLINLVQGGILITAVLVSRLGQRSA